MANLKNAKKRISVNIKKEARNNEYSAREYSKSYC